MVIEMSLERMRKEFQMIKMNMIKVYRSPGLVCNHDVHSHFVRPPQHRSSPPAPIALIDLIKIHRISFYVCQQPPWPILEGIDPETTESSAIFCEADPHPQSWGRRSFLFYSLCTLTSQSTPLQEVRYSPAP